MATNDTATQTPEMLFEEPFNALSAEMKALSPAEIFTVNLDIIAAVTTVLGVQPEVLALQDRIAKLPEFNVELPLKLEVYAKALSHAQTLFAMASAPASAIKPLADEGVALRETLFADTSALVQRKLLDGNQLKDLRGVVGYKNLAFDLQVLAQVFRTAAPAVQGRCATQPAEVTRADQIAATLLKLVGIQEQAPATIALISDTRNRAFTLFVNAYDEIRRAVTYLRWQEKDTDDIAPSLYAGRAVAKKKSDVPEPAPAPTPSPTDPVTGPAAPAPTTPVVAPAASPAANGAKTGPGASPFVTRADLDS